jgi:hypothetical protein
MHFECGLKGQSCVYLTKESTLKEINKNKVSWYCICLFIYNWTIYIAHPSYMYCPFAFVVVCMYSAMIVSERFIPIFVCFHFNLDWYCDVLIAFFVNVLKNYRFYVPAKISLCLRAFVFACVNLRKCMYPNKYVYRV